MSTELAPTISIDGPEVLAACKELGWDGIREIQRRVLEPLFGGKHIVGVLPTSAGKSGLYQIPALARPGLVVVISPLVALMKDQVSKLHTLGIEAYALNSHCSLSEKKRAVDAVRSGTAKLLYVSPERMLSMDKNFFEGSTVQLYAVDECHCISEWGHDFRPAYYRLGRSLGRFPDAQRLALTATATQDVVDEVSHVLGVYGDVTQIVVSPDRPNIAYGVAGRKVSLVRLVENAGLPCLVYGSTRKGVEAAATELSKSARDDVQERFTAGEYQVITATCAFGMGIDHAGIRSVVHLEMPTSLEAYAQETGRAGRDGSPSRAICRATVETLDIARSLVRLNWPTAEQIMRCWREIQTLFDSDVDGFHGPERIQLSDARIGTLIGMHAIEVGSCLRILASGDNVRRIAAREQPFEISLLTGARNLKGKRQKSVVSKLEEYADIHGTVVGTAAFYIHEIGLDKPYARKLQERGAISMSWSESCQVIERLHERVKPEFDRERVDKVRQRSLRRLDRARNYLTYEGCRREYLVGYFGDGSGGQADGVCCDRCKAGLSGRTW